MNCYSPNFQGFILMKNALNNQVGMLGDMFLWLVASLKQGVIYFIKQALPQTNQPGVYVLTSSWIGVACQNLQYKLQYILGARCTILLHLFLITLLG